MGQNYFYIFTSIVLHLALIFFLFKNLDEGFALKIEGGNQVFEVETGNNAGLQQPEPNLELSAPLINKVNTVKQVLKLKSNPEVKQTEQLHPRSETSKVTIEVKQEKTPDPDLETTRDEKVVQQEVDIPLENLIESPVDLDELTNLENEDPEPRAKIDIPTKLKSDGEVLNNNSEILDNLNIDTNPSQGLGFKEDGTNEATSYGDTQIYFENDLTPITNHSVSYPEESKQSREAGTVKMDIFYDENGELEKARILKSSGHNRLDKAALMGIRTLKFKSLGHPFVFRTNFNFRLESNFPNDLSGPAPTVIGE